MAVQLKIKVLPSKIVKTVCLLYRPAVYISKNVSCMAFDVFTNQPAHAALKFEKRREDFPPLLTRAHVADGHFSSRKYIVAVFTFAS